MTTRLAVIFSALALVFSLLGAGTFAAAADYGFVPFASPYGNVTITSTSASRQPLVLNTPQWSYGALLTKDYLGRFTSTIASDGQIKTFAVPTSSGTETPRMVIQSFGYDGLDHPDALQMNIAGSTVASISAGGTFERYNTYANTDSPAFAVEDYGDHLYGGISGNGALITAKNTAPNPASIPNGEARIWFDPAAGTGGMMATYRDNAGAVKTVRLG